MSPGRAIRTTVVALAVALAAPAAGAAAPASAAAGAAATTPRATCAAKVTIAGKRTCLKAGMRCKRKYERKYTSKGYSCQPAAKGRYRLRKRKLEF